MNTVTMIMILVVVIIIGALLWFTGKLIVQTTAHLRQNKQDFPKKSVAAAVVVLAFAAVYICLTYDGGREYPFKAIEPPAAIKTDAPDSVTIENTDYKRAFSSNYRYYGQYGDVLVLRTDVESEKLSEYQNTQACCLVTKDGRLITRGNEYYVFAGLSTKYMYGGEPVIVCENRLTSLSDGTILAKEQRLYYSLSGKALSESELEEDSSIPLDRFEKRSINGSGVAGVILEPTGDVICIQRDNEYDYYIKE